MRTTRLGLLAALPVLLGGCLYDGMYVVRGRVSEESGGVQKPLPGVTVAARNGRAGRPQRPATTGADGTYEASYWYGGMQLLFYVPTGDAYLEFAAPGYRTKLVRVRDAAARCARNPPWFGLDVVLTPEREPPASSAAGTRAVCPEPPAPSRAGAGPGT